MIETWREVPAFMVDRHLNVTAANSLVRRLFPGCDPGVNVVRYAFENRLPWFSEAQLAELKGMTAAALRDSLDRSSPDQGFIELVGDMAVEYDDFAASWAEEGTADVGGMVVLNDPTVGTLRLTWQMLDIPETDGHRLCVWGTADGESADALARIVSGP